MRDEAEQIVAHWQKEFGRRLDVEVVREHLKMIREWEKDWAEEDPLDVFK